MRRQTTRCQGIACIISAAIVTLNSCESSDDHSANPCPAENEWRDAICLVDSIKNLKFIDTTGTVLLEIPGSWILNPPVWSPCKDQIAVLPKGYPCHVFVAALSELPGRRLQGCWPSPFGVTRLEPGAWSPDGSVIVIELEQTDRIPGVYLFRREGTPFWTGVYVLVEGSAGAPSFIDDSSIVFEYYIELDAPLRRSWIARASVDGGAITIIARADSGTFSGTLPTFYLPRVSPDGDEIAFVYAPVASASSENEIWITKNDGSNKRLIASSDSFGGGLVLSMTFSPDGRHLLFDIVGNSELFIAEVEGNKVHSIPGTACDGQRHGASWSPDSQWIVYQEATNENSAIAIIRLDGTGYRRIAAEGKSPAW